MEFEAWTPKKFRQAYTTREFSSTYALPVIKWVAIGGNIFGYQEAVEFWYALGKEQVLKWEK